MSSNLPYIALLDGPAADVLDFFQRRAAWHISDLPNSMNVRLDAITSVTVRQFNRLPTFLYEFSAHPLHPRRVVHRVLAGLRSENREDMIPPGVARALGAAGVGPALIPDPYRPEHVSFPFIEASFSSEETTRDRTASKYSHALSLSSATTHAHARARSSTQTSSFVVDIAVAHRPRSFLGLPVAPTPADTQAALPPLEFILGAQASPAVGSGTVNVGAAATLCNGTVRVAADADVFRRISSSVLVTPMGGVQIAARVSANLIASCERFAVGARVVLGPTIASLARLLERPTAPPAAAIPPPPPPSTASALATAVAEAVAAVVDVGAVEAHAVTMSSATSVGVAVPIILPIWPWRLYVSAGAYANHARTADGGGDTRTLFAVWTDAPFEQSS